MQYGLSLKSKFQSGTCVTFVIPARIADATEDEADVIKAVPVA
jgi:hypothetical protein